MLHIFSLTHIYRINKFLTPPTINPREKNLIFVFYNVAILTEDAVSHEFDSLTDCFCRKFIFMEEKLVFLGPSLLSLEN